MTNKNPEEQTLEERLMSFVENAESNIGSEKFDPLIEAEKNYAAARSQYGGGETQDARQNIKELAVNTVMDLAYNHGDLLEEMAEKPELMIAYGNTRQRPSGLTEVMRDDIDYGRNPDRSKENKMHVEFMPKIMLLAYGTKDLDEKTREEFLENYLGAMEHHYCDCLRPGEEEFPVYSKNLPEEERDEIRDSYRDTMKEVTKKAKERGASDDEIERIENEYKEKIDSALKEKKNEYMQGPGYDTGDRVLANKAVLEMTETYNAFKGRVQEFIDKGNELKGLQRDYQNKHGRDEYTGKATELGKCFYPSFGNGIVRFASDFDSGVTPTAGSDFTASTIEKCIKGEALTHEAYVEKGRVYFNKQ